MPKEIKECPNESEDSPPYFIPDVVVCTSLSKNGYSYSLDALKKATRLYHGKAVYLDHKDKSVKDKIGWIENPRFISDGKSGKIIADLFLIPTHQFAKNILWASKYKPDLFSLSHHIDGVMDETNNNVIEIKQVYSVDLVGVGGTTKTLFEQKGSKMLVSLREQFDNIVKNETTNASQVFRLKKIKSITEDVVDYDKLSTQHVDSATDGNDFDSFLLSVFNSMLQKFLEGSLSPEDFLARIKLVLKHFKALKEANDSLEEPDVEDEPENDEVDEGEGDAETGELDDEKQLEESDDVVDEENPEDEVSPDSEEVSEDEEDFEDEEDSEDEDDIEDEEPDEEDPEEEAVTEGAKKKKSKLEESRRLKRDSRKAKMKKSSRKSKLKETSKKLRGLAKKSKMKEARQKKKDNLKEAWKMCSGLGITPTGSEIEIMEKLSTFGDKILASYVRSLANSRYKPKSLGKVSIKEHLSPRAEALREMKKILKDIRVRKGFNVNE